MERAVRGEEVGNVHTCLCMSRGQSGEQCTFMILTKNLIGSFGQVGIAGQK